MRGSLGRWWRKLLGRPEPPTPEEAEALAHEFRRRYHDFRLVLAANNAALERIAEMELAATGERLFGMSFVRARCTQVAVSVQRIVRHLESLAPGRFPALPVRLAAVGQAIQEALAPQEVESAGVWICHVSSAGSRDGANVGGKMRNLAELSARTGLRVPEGFVVTAHAFRRFIEHNHLREEIDQLIQTSEGDDAQQLYVVSSQIQQRIVRSVLPAELAQALEQAYRSLELRTHPGVRVAVRSSAAGEDSAEFSFAGQYRSTLNVSSDDLQEVYKEIVASTYSPQAMEYRYRRGLRDQDFPMSVGCLVMVEARAGGVAYTGNPTNADDARIHVSANYGLPGAVVQGRVEVDHYTVDRLEPWPVVERQIAKKRQMLRCHPGVGLQWDPLDDAQVTAPCLTDEQLTTIARAGVRLEAHFGSPQDVEWAFDDAGELVILQSRPLRQVSLRAPVTATACDHKPLLSGGVRASPGAAAGQVCWLSREVDALSFVDGALLALEVPEPRWAALLSRAVGVVAVHGGVAGHLATVARELGKPALFGLGEALRQVASGAEVTLDATGRAVYAGRVDSLLTPAAAPAVPSIVGSPVHSVLLAALEHVAPLTLLDPDAPEFQADRCKTLHDITRFCHEMAVREMFDFGKESRLARHASKQLRYQVPMQWWVLDLEDGFRQPVQGRYVELEDIQSAPMLAVWQGMLAIPWAGPPSLSGRGMAAVMFEATRNPALATPYRRPVAQQNYFMISKEYLSLESRFGFHFASVEALMSQRPTENFIRFSFRGGAADDQRRLARVELVAALMEPRGFETSVTGDSLVARMSAAGAADIGHRLGLVGYLLMHTRQLDMIMGDPGLVRSYRAKLERDMDRLLQGLPQ